MDVHETIKDIKGQFRLFMNGVASQSMREKGLDYKLNFGIDLPRLKEIAARYEKNHENFARLRLHAFSCARRNRMFVCA